MSPSDKKKVRRDIYDWSFHACMPIYPIICLIPSKKLKKKKHLQYLPEPNMMSTSMCSPYATQLAVCFYNNTNNSLRVHSSTVVPASPDPNCPHLLPPTRARERGDWYLPLTSTLANYNGKLPPPQDIGVNEIRYIRRQRIYAVLSSGSEYHGRIIYRVCVDTDATSKG